MIWIFSYIQKIIIFLDLPVLKDKGRETAAVNTAVYFGFYVFDTRNKNISSYATFHSSIVLIIWNSRHISLLVVVIALWCKYCIGISLQRYSSLFHSIQIMKMKKRQTKSSTTFHRLRLIFLLMGRVYEAIASIPAATGCNCEV